MKAIIPEEAMAVLNAPTPAEAKKLSHRVIIRPNWDDYRVDVMNYLLHLKFADFTLQSYLLGTGDQELIEGNYWRDYFWGVCDGVGENMLGKLLMTIREEKRSADKKV
jgi:predicted NAD-dependent protein-ADP-ribosyltransferase YbiA (DUF1768 family)